VASIYPSGVNRPHRREEPDAVHLLLAADYSFEGLSYRVGFGPHAQGLAGPVQQVLIQTESFFAATAGPR